MQKRTLFILIMILFAALTIIAQPMANGQRVMVAGHSFHVPMATILTEIAHKAGFAEHQLLGKQFIGGSTVTQHWELPIEKNIAKREIATGMVDVLTLSPHIKLPDNAIDSFTELLLQKNSKARVLVQESWMPYDGQQATQDRAALNRNARTTEELQRIQANWDALCEKQINDINKRFDHQVVFFVPVAQAIFALRGKILAGDVPTIANQDSVFTDAMGHPGPYLTLLSAYCHYAVIYRKSPVGIDFSKIGSKTITDAENRLLQQLAWEAVIKHPLSGVKDEPKK